MRRGYTLVELTLVLVIAGFVLVFSLPKLRGLLDALAVDAAARDVSTALAAARQTALARGHRVRVRLATDSIWLDTLGDKDWGPYQKRTGPRERGASLSATNPVIVFAPSGVTWGVSNTSITLQRGSHVETVVVSRVGRVRRA